MALTPGCEAISGCSNTFSPRYPAGSLGRKAALGWYVFQRASDASMLLSTRSKVPAPVTCRRSVRGSPAVFVAEEISALILNEPTAPPKPAGRPSVGRGRTVKAASGLVTVMFFVMLAPNRFCMKGSPRRSSIIESLRGCVRMRTVAGVEKLSE